MPSWDLFYQFIVLLGRGIPSGQVDDATFHGCVLELATKLKDRFGGVTKVKILQAHGDTATWSTEESLLVVCLTPAQENAGAVVEEETSHARATLKQDEVWVTRHDVLLHKSKS